MMDSATIIGMIIVGIYEYARTHPIADVIIIGVFVIAYNYYKRYNQRRVNTHET